MKRGLLKPELFAAAACVAIGAAPLTALAQARTAPARPTAPPAAAAPTPAATAADWQTLDPESLLVIDTSKGRVVVELRQDVAPDYVARIKTLARQGYYDGLVFFRVIDDFMAQTGDKANTGAGKSDLPSLKGLFDFRRGPDMAYAEGGKTPKGVGFGFVGPLPVYTQPDALMGLTADGKVKAWPAFCPGVAGMARTSEPDSASTQFFLMRQNTPALENKYTAWGRVVSGLEVVRALNVGEPPATPDSMTKVRVAADLPAGERPVVRRLDPRSAAFKAQVAAALQAKGADFTPCDVEPAVQVAKG